MYAYNLLVESPDRKPDELSRWDPVRPGPDLEIPTLAALQEQVIHDLGFLPEWLTGFPLGTYLQEEDCEEVGGVWFLLDIEGSQTHELPPLAQRIAFGRNHGKG